MGARPAGLSSATVESADGTWISGHWSPLQPAKNSGPRSTVVLMGDLAETVPDVWRPQLDYLGRNERHVRFVTWAYRGTGASQAGTSHDVAAHLEDLWAVLAGAGLAPTDPFVVIGSGVGVRIAVEAALANPDRVRGLVLIGGAAGWRYRWLCRVAWVAARVEDNARRRKHPAALMRAATHGVDRILQLAEMSLVERGTEPSGALGAIAGSLSALGTEPIVAQARMIEQPTLVLCGAHDPRMPAALAHQLGRNLRQSRVLIVPRSTSRIAARLPDLVNLEIERFLEAVFAVPTNPEPDR